MRSKRGKIETHTIDISCFNHVANLVVSKRLTQVLHSLLNLLGANESIAVDVEYIERLLELIGSAQWLYLSMSHHLNELVIVDITISLIQSQLSVY